VSGCAEDMRDICAQYFWRFSFYRPALFGISTLPPGTTGIPTLAPVRRKKVAFQRFNCHQKLDFRYRRDKKKRF